jgi:predicted TIM-barrel fold metal-dependent hydrolase
MLPEDLILVSVDDHVCEPEGMFDGHVPARYRDLAPRVRTTDDGRQQWWYGDIPGRSLGLNAVAGKPPEFFNVEPSRYDEMRPGCFDVHERVRDMSAGGQLGGLNFPNFPGFAAPVLSAGPDRAVNMAMIRAYNDWHVEEWAGTYPDRLIPCGVLPLFDPELAAEEIRRLAAAGCHAVTFSENPTALGAPSIHSGGWDPVFRAASDVGTVLCCHVGSSARSTVTTADAPPGVTMTLVAVAAASTMADLMWAELWNKFPDLKFSLTEGDIGWIPYFLQKSERVNQKHRAWLNHHAPQGRSPSQIFHDQILCCFIADEVGVGLLDQFNLDNVCWESDFPHSETPWPNGPEELAVSLSGLPHEAIDKMTHGNAMRHFQFEPFARRSREKCTAGSLRAEASDVDVVTHVGRHADERDSAAFKAFTTGVRTDR